MGKKGKKILLVVIPSVAVLYFIGLFASLHAFGNLGLSNDEVRAIYEKNQEEITAFATSMFDMIDESPGLTGGRASISDLIPESLSDDIHSASIGDETVIFLQCDALFQSARGIAITRGEEAPGASYPHTGYDGGISYEAIGEHVYVFSAGL